MDLIILEDLEEAHPRMLKQSTLQASVSMKVDDFTVAGFERALRVLERKKQIRVFAGEDVKRVKITDEGLSRLADAQ